MPIYDYHCTRCGDFSLSRSIVLRDEPALCPHCRRLGSRSVTAPRLSLMQSHERLAHQRNEKSRHEPGVSNRHRCGTGCGCGTCSKRSGTGIGPKKRSVEVPKLGKFETSRRRQRPWMLGH